MSFFYVCFILRTIIIVTASALLLPSNIMASQILKTQLLIPLTLKNG